ncbi:MAG: DUF3703 domain-containing protein [Psychrobium sp.]|nr:DUF3703 domain-containing protein [Psychrobium sp.]
MFNKFTKNIKPYVDAQLLLARKTTANGDMPPAFKYLENAHVLGQESTYLHVKVHFMMFLWALRSMDFRELVGQLFRMVGAATKTAFGLVPSGNTGGANVSPFKVMPISKEHAQCIENAKKDI